MDDLQTQLAHSYELHPHFRFDRPPLQLDPGRLGAFNTAYEFARTFRGRLNSPLFLSCRRQCTQELADVFSELKVQTADQLEVRFLQELQAECRRLLLEELDYFRARHSGSGVAFPGQRMRADALRLQQDRYFFGVLPSEVTREILDIGAPDLSAFRQNAKQGRLTREDLSVNTGPKVHKISHILNRAYRALGVLDAVGTYAGHPMSVTGLAFELSVPQANWWVNSYGQLPRAPMTLYAHMDESVKFPKSIVYLSEVDETNGQTSCYLHAYEALGLNPLQEIVGRVLSNVGNSPESPLRDYYAKQYHQSMSSGRFRQHFMRLPAVMRFNSHFGWDVLPGSEAEATLVRRERLMTGPPGTFIVFDGARLLHRGGMVQKKERIALQVVFSVTTFPRRILGKIRNALT